MFINFRRRYSILLMCSVKLITILVSYTEYFLLSITVTFIFSIAKDKFEYTFSCRYYSITPRIFLQNVRRFISGFRHIDAPCDQAVRTRLPRVSVWYAKRWPSTQPSRNRSRQFGGYRSPESIWKGLPERSNAEQLQYLERAVSDGLR